jgi:hypothetical protein
LAFSAKASEVCVSDKTPSEAMNTIFIVFIFLDGFSVDWTRFGARERYQPSRRHPSALIDPWPGSIRGVSQKLQVSIPGMKVISCLLSGPIVCPGPSGQWRAGRQDGQGNRYDEERRHVTCQVLAS